MIGLFGDNRASKIGGKMTDQEIREVIEVGKEIRYWLTTPEMYDVKYDAYLNALPILIELATAFLNAEMPERKQGIDWNDGKPSPTDREKIAFNSAFDLCRVIIAKKDLEIEELKGKIK
jgi:hypothetical protein